MQVLQMQALVVCEETFGRYLSAKKQIFFARSAPIPATRLRGIASSVYKKFNAWSPNSKWDKVLKA